MKPMDALRIDGTSRLQILCYGVFPLEKVDLAAHESINEIENYATRVFPLSDDDWPFGLVLFEREVESTDQIAIVIAALLGRMNKLQFNVAAVCMFDGALGQYKDIFSSDLSSATYAFSFSPLDIVCNLDSELIESEAWRDVIKFGQEKMKSRARDFGISMPD